MLAEYWFVSAKGNFQRTGYEVTPEVLQRVGQTLGTVVAGIEGGVFPSYPADSNSGFIACHPCDPDGLGVTELSRAWSRKRSDPALAVFANLAGPLHGVDAVIGGPDD